MAQTIADMLADKTQLVVRSLTHQDDAALYELQQANQAFYDLFLDHQLTKQEAIRILDAVPLQSAEGKKHDLGFFKNGQLMANLDLIVEYPIPQVAWLGQYFWQPDAVGGGQAQTWLKSALTVLQALGTVQVQLMVLTRDLAGQRFYEALGFTPVQETVADVLTKSVPVRIYQVEIPERHQ